MRSEAVRSSEMSRKAKFQRFADADQFYKIRSLRSGFNKMTHSGGGKHKCSKRIGITCPLFTVKYSRIGVCLDIIPYYVYYNRLYKFSLSLMM